MVPLCSSQSNEIAWSFSSKNVRYAAIGSLVGMILIGVGILLREYGRATGLAGTLTLSLGTSLVGFSLLYLLFSRVIKTKTLQKEKVEKARLCRIEKIKTHERAQQCVLVKLEAVRFLQDPNPVNLVKGSASEVWKISSLVFEILQHVPAQGLERCMCIDKSFYHIIQNTKLLKFNLFIGRAKHCVTKIRLFKDVLAREPLKKIVQIEEDLESAYTLFNDLNDEVAQKELVIKITKKGISRNLNVTKSLVKKVEDFDSQVRGWVEIYKAEQSEENLNLLNSFLNSFFDLEANLFAWLELYKIGKSHLLKVEKEVLEGLNGFILHFIDVEPTVENIEKAKKFARTLPLEKKVNAWLKIYKVCSTAEIYQETEKAIKCLCSGRNEASAWLAWYKMFPTDEKLQRAKNCAESVGDYDSYDQLWKEIAFVEIEKGDLKSAEISLSKIERVGTKEIVLAELAKALAPHDLAKAKEMARRIDSGFYAAKAWSAIWNVEKTDENLRNVTRIMKIKGFPADHAEVWADLAGYVLN